MDKTDIVLEGLQAVNRHYLLTKFDDNDLKEALEEQKELVNKIENGDKVYREELRLFIEDINLLWETYQENK